MAAGLTRVMLLSECEMTEESVRSLTVMARALLFVWEAGREVFPAREMPERRRAHLSGQRSHI